MRAAAYVGRVGGLAVALGVGAALFTGTGLAWADPDASTSSDSPSSESSPAKPSGAAPSSAVHTNGRTSSVRGSAVPKPNVAETKDEDQGGDEKDIDEEEGKTKAEPAKADLPEVDSAPVDPTSIGTEEPDTKPDPDQPDPDQPDPDEPTADADPVELRHPATGAGPTTPSFTKSESEKSDNGKAEPSVARARSGKVDASEVTSAGPQPESLQEGVNARSKMTAAQAMTSLGEVRDAATPVVVPSLRPWPTAFDPGTVVTYLTGIVSSLVNAVLSPFAAGIPALPADPSAWSLLAWVRRELFNESPTLTYDPVQSTQSLDGDGDVVVTGSVGLTDQDLDPTASPSSGGRTTVGPSKSTRTATSPTGP